MCPSPYAHKVPDLTMTFPSPPPLHHSLPTYTTNPQPHRPQVPTLSAASCPPDDVWGHVHPTGPRVSPTWCVEIKPKWGGLPSSPYIRP